MHLPFHDARSANRDQLVDLLTDVECFFDCDSSCACSTVLLGFWTLVGAGDKLKVAHSQIARLLLHRTFLLLVGGRLKVLLTL